MGAADSNPPLPAHGVPRALAIGETGPHTHFPTHESAHPISLPHAEKRRLSDDGMIKHRPCPGPPCPCARRARYAPPKVEVLLHDVFFVSSARWSPSFVDSLFINKVLASHVVFAVFMLHFKRPREKGEQRGETLRSSPTAPIEQLR